LAGNHESEGWSTCDGKKVTLAPRTLFVGVCVSPFKKLEPELLAQYYKLEEEGRGRGPNLSSYRSATTPAKFHEVLQWLRVNHYDVPVLANIYVLPLGAARLMKNNKIPVCRNGQAGFGNWQKKQRAPDKGKAGRLLRARTLYAFPRGWGMRGLTSGATASAPRWWSTSSSKGEELSKDWEKTGSRVRLSSTRKGLSF